jgi:rhodanese-related sulfurtransferase
VNIDELSRRLDDPTLTVVDVRTGGEYDGTRGNACDPRQGHIPGARNLDITELMHCETVEQVLELVGLIRDRGVLHSGSRSALAVQILTAAGYDASNYAGSVTSGRVRRSRPSRHDRDCVLPASAETRNSCAPKPAVVDALAQLGHDRVAVRPLAATDPLLDLLESDLRVELQPPRVVAEAERLGADARARQLDRSFGHVERVLVHGEDVELVRKWAEQWIVLRVVGQRDSHEAALALRRRADMCDRGLRQQLAPEANAKHGHLTLDEGPDQLVLVAQPGMLVLLVDVHLAAEDEHGVVPVGGGKRVRIVNDGALDELVPVRAHDVAVELRAHVGAVHERQDPHQKSLAFDCAGSMPPVAHAPGRASRVRPALRGA